MLLTQPFLLYLVLRGERLKSPKKNWFEKLGEICVDAAKNAVVVLKSMAKDQSLSSLVTFDCVCALKIVFMLLLVISKNDLPEYRADIEVCVSLLEGMEQIGFCKTVVDELPSRLAGLGYKREHIEADIKSDTVVQDDPSQLWTNFDL